MDNKIKIKGRITRVGNSYAILIPKALIDSNVLKERELVILEIAELPQRNNMRELGFNPWFENNPGVIA